MQLIYYPDSRLLSPCIAVDGIGGIDPKYKELRTVLLKFRSVTANKMWVIMNKNNGVGLAAPQIGLPDRMFIWNQNNNYQAIWNPILSCVRGCETSIEGCLSLPKVNVTMQRATSSILSGTDQNGHPVRLIGNSAMTRIWQHELDHLDGKLIIDNMNRQEQIANRDAMRTLLKNTVA